MAKKKTMEPKKASLFIIIHESMVQLNEARGKNDVTKGPIFDDPQYECMQIDITAGS